MNISHLKRYGALYAKNSLGKRTSRKIVAFSVDDYGVQRTASIEARTAMERTGMDLHTNRFDWYDSLETEADLTALWETLDSVRDCNGAPAIFTAFACPANMDYDTLVDSGGTQYGIILLPDLYRKTESGNAMELWRQGIASKLVNVQYHGREHVNLRTLRKLLQDNDAQVWCNIKNGSWAGISRRISEHISYVSAYQFDSKDELPELIAIAQNGLDVFENVWGYRAVHFTAPGAREHISLDMALSEGGIKYVDTDVLYREHQGDGLYKRRFNIPFGRNSMGQYYVVRNCVYEPMLPCSGNWADYLLFQIQAAINCGKPANISTHRVNFSGRLSAENRDKHLAELKQILGRIKKRWPDIEFMSTSQMMETMINL